MQKKLIFNPKGNDSLDTTQIINGNSTSLLKLVEVKYPWALQIYRKQMSQFWIPEKVDLTKDVLDYPLLTPEEKKAYKGILSFLVFLDSIQTLNLPRISDYVTASEVNLALTVQAFQEAVHSQSYGYMIETIIPQEDKTIIYDFWREDEQLKDRILVIAEVYQKFSDDPNHENFINMLIGNFCLEGLMFYVGFNFFYSLAYHHKMPATSEIFSYINKDELTHVILFQYILNELINTKDYKKEIYQIFDRVVQAEIKWNNYILGNQILGFNENTIDNYVKYIANERLSRINLEPLYTDVKYKKNPFAHLEKIANITSDSDVKANFFESTVTNYSMSNAVKGWEKLSA
jgi:ribonucleoside-diphosphate reductase beta chain